MNYERMLEERFNIMLEWATPHPACGPEGNELDAHVVSRATVHDCVNMQRRMAKAKGRPTLGRDAEHLADFMAVHWAYPIKKETKKEC